LPLTPFHFGPGLFLKGILPRHFSWGTFVLTQVVIDCETLYYLMHRTYPIHRTLHTFLGATIAGLLTACFVLVCKRMLRRALPQVYDEFAKQKPVVRSEGSTSGILVGGLVGGVSHPFLDGIMHRDIRPFAPWSDANPLLNWIGLAPLHLLCVLSGVVGLAIIVILLSRQRKAG